MQQKADLQQTAYVQSQQFTHALTIYRCSAGNAYAILYVCSQDICYRQNVSLKEPIK